MRGLNRLARALQEGFWARASLREVHAAEEGVEAGACGACHAIASCVSSAFHALGGVLRQPAQGPIAAPLSFSFQQRLHLQRLRSEKTTCKLLQGSGVPLGH